MLKGKYWITPEGVIDVNGSEHKISAVRKIFRTRPEDNLWTNRSAFFDFTLEDRKKLMRRGINKSAVKLLCDDHIDPRFYAMQHYGWVRVAHNEINAWKMDRATLDLIRAAEDYWGTQLTANREYGFVLFYELFSNTERDIPVKFLVPGSRNPLSKFRSFLKKEAKHACV